LNKRETYLDMTKGIGIIMVVLGHMYGALSNFDGATFNFFSPYYQYVASYHMPLFFVVSGIILSMTGEENKPLWESIFKKFRTIMIPYFAMFIICGIILIYSD